LEIFSYFYFSSDVIKFDDFDEFEKLLIITTPLKEHFLCAIIERDTGRPKDIINQGQFLGIFDELFVTIELDLVKLAIASPCFTISFEEAYKHFNADRNLRSSIRRNLRKSRFFKSEKCNVFF